MQLITSNRLPVTRYVRVSTGLTSQPEGCYHRVTVNVKVPSYANDVTLSCTHKNPFRTSSLNLG